MKFETKHTVEEAAREIYDALEKGLVKDDLTTITVKWYKHLLELHKFIKDIEKYGRIL